MWCDCEHPSIPSYSKLNIYPHAEVLAFNVIHVLTYSLPRIFVLGGFKTYKEIECGREEKNRKYSVAKRKGTKNNHRPTRDPRENFSKCSCWFLRNPKKKKRKKEKKVDVLLKEMALCKECKMGKRVWSELSRESEPFYLFVNSFGW